MNAFNKQEPSHKQPMCDSMLHHVHEVCNPTSVIWHAAVGRAFVMLVALQAACSIDVRIT